MTHTAIDFILENLKQLINCSNPFILLEKNQIQSLYEELRFLRTFLKDSEGSCYEHEKVKMKIGDVAYEAESMVDMFVVSTMAMKNDDHLCDDFSLKLDHVMEEIKSIKTEVMEIDGNKVYDIGNGVLQSGNPTDVSSSRGNFPKVEEEITVGLDDETMAIVERLTGDQKQLDIITIVGMAGLGKTTLAKKVFNDPLVTYHFYIRAWITVSQTYQKRYLLLGILNSALLLTDQHLRMSEQRLCEELYRQLKGNRYLIVIDDIWDMGAWEDLRRSFPNDNNCSRILLTSRLRELAAHVKPDVPPHFLRFLTAEESWDLLQQKVFQEDSCLPSLIDIGKQIAKKCEGLPLAIVVVAGILSKRDKAQDRWKEVAQSLRTCLVDDPKRYMDTLALSYNHLPLHLKPCFLYLGAFREDSEIPVRKLILLWVAEGFIRPEGQKCLEDVAEECLIDLIDRSLVIVSQRRINGGIKSCRIHDLLRELCLREADKKNFLTFSSSIAAKCKHRRLCTHSCVSYNIITLAPYTRYTRSFLCYAHYYVEPSLEKNSSFIYQAFKILRVLDIESIGVSSFPNEINLLVHLRFLALRTFVGRLPSSISGLHNLQTLIVKGLSFGTVLPGSIWKMVNLRHIYIQGGAYIPLVKEPSDIILFNLQTVSTLILSCSNQEVLSMIPNIRKLHCVFPVGSYVTTTSMRSSLISSVAFPKLDCLTHLETIKVFNYKVTIFPVRLTSFPSSVKKVTLYTFSLPWSHISILGKLPNLQILKLVDGAFRGRWDMQEGEFGKLEFLKLKSLYITEWNASSEYLPCLKHLVLVNCINLKEIPNGLGDIYTLEMIKLEAMSRSAEMSARQIQQEQQSKGNDWLKIIISGHMSLPSKGVVWGIT